MGNLSDAAAWHTWFKRTGRRELRDVIMREWDPIGVVDVPEPEDEYDAYLAIIADRLRLSASVDELAELLEKLRTETMGMPPARSADAAASDALISWYQAQPIDGPPSEDKSGL